MPNPALKPEIFDREAARVATSLQQSGTYVPPAPDAVSQWPPPGAPPPPTVGYPAMTTGGVATATGVLLSLVVAAGVFGWMQVEPLPETGGIDFPGWIFLPLIAAFGVAIVTVFKPAWARVTGPIYAILEGIVLGAISHLYELRWDGIVLQAVGLTIGVFAVMLFIFSTRIIRVTNRLRVGIIAATGAVMLVYLVNIVLNLFGADLPFIHDGGAFSILFSLVVVGIAAFNLLLDFDFVERGVAAQAPKHMEWYGAFGLLITLVWLYLEILRLLGNLRR
ncbi:MAG: Bax inhibitor-1/YccA family protein [Acidimicrobiales bacterium]